MKYIFAFFLVISCYSVQAQFGNPYGRGGRQRSSVPQAGAGQQQAAPEKPDANILSSDKGEMYAELLGLDVFTKEVLKNYLKDYYSKLIEITFNKETPVEDKRKAIEASKKEFEKSLSDILTEEQVQKLMIEEDSGKESKKFEKEKRKKKKKRKRDKKNIEN